jgi:hypothetical protein
MKEKWRHEFMACGMNKPLEKSHITGLLKWINEIHRVLSRKYYYLSSMDELLKVFENEIFTSQVLNDIKLNISGSKLSASVSVNRLHHLIQVFDSRLNILVGFVLNGLFLWDYQCIYK